jgi:hypothetical protein
VGSPVARCAGQKIARKRAGGVVTVLTRGEEAFRSPFTDAERKKLLAKRSSVH